MTYEIVQLIGPPMLVLASPTISIFILIAILITIPYGGASYCIEFSSYLWLLDMLHVSEAIHDIFESIKINPTFIN